MEVNRALIVLVILLLFTSVSFSFTSELIERGGNAFNSSQCQLTLLANDAVRYRDWVTFGSKNRDQIPVSCPMIRSEITIDDIGYSTGKGEKERRVNAIFAQSLIDCRNKITTGERDFIFQPFDRSTDDVYCILCEKIEFEEEIHDVLPKVSNIMTYLRTVQHEGLSIFQYVFEGGAKASVLSPQDQFTIDTSKKYISYYTFQAKGTGSKKPEHTIGIIPTDYVSKLACSRTVQ